VGESWREREGGKGEGEKRRSQGKGCESEDGVAKTGGDGMEELLR
jgi:hypothetical protein